MIYEEKPYWIMTANKPGYPVFEGKKQCEIAVIGAGITGVTAAYLLSKRGISTVLLDANQIGHGTTGRTTGKVTYQHQCKYQTLINGVGAEDARTYADANRQGLEQIAAWADELNIDCDFQHVDSYVYAGDDKELEILEQEMQAYTELGISAELMDSCPLPFDVKGALMLKNQAQFHPLKYLYGLLSNIDTAKCAIYEYSPVRKLEYEDKCIIHCDWGDVIADKVLIATNYPVKDLPGLYFARLYQQRSYISGFLSGGMDLKGIYINASDTVNSFRMQPEQGENLVFAAGYGNRTGKDEYKQDNFAMIMQTVENKLGIKGEPLYHWSAQDCMTLDHLPYAGQLCHFTPNLFISTGYEKWGMTNATACAMLVSNLMLSENHSIMRAKEAFNPLRLTPKASAKEFASHIGEVVFGYGIKRVATPVRDPGDLKPGEGDVMRVNGQLAAVYRNDDGTLHAFKPQCTHMGCLVSFNSVDESWDCACHGSRFDVFGNVITGPAVEPLHKTEI